MVMMTIGLNYRTAPIHIREKLAFDREGSIDLLRHLVDGTIIREAVLLPTCNRTELYCESDDEACQENWKETVWLPLSKRILKNKNLSDIDLGDYTYAHFGLDTVKHLMRVVSGLDSMILGEVEIVGQVKKAYHLSNQLGVVGRYLGRLFETAFQVAKKVRSSTDIGTHPISVAYAAVKLSSHIFSDLTESSVLLIGAGELIQLTAKYLKECGVKKIWIANRTKTRAIELAAEIEAEVIAFEDIREHLFAADIIITGIESPLPILGKGMIECAVRLRKHKPMYMVDLGFPRNIEPEVSQLEDVFLYSIDDLQGIVADNRRMRQNAAMIAEQIIDDEARSFMEWVNAEESFKTIFAFRTKCEELRDQVLKEGLHRLKVGEDADRVLQRALYSLTNRFMHLPTRRLRSASFEQEKQLLDLTKDLFELQEIESLQGAKVLQEIKLQNIQEIKEIQNEKVHIE